MSLTAEQHVIRATGVGGSEIAAVCGLNPYATAIDVWQAKMGFTQEVLTFHMERGDFLEDGLRGWYSHRTGLFATKAPTFRHPKYPHVLSTPDGLVYASKKAAKTDKPLRTLEAKSPAGWRTADDWGEPGTDQVPNYYVPQVTLEAGCAGVPLADACALLDGDLKVYTVPFNEALFEALAQRAEQFWADYIVTQTPPPPEATQSYAKWLARKFPVSVGQMLVANAAMEDAAEELRVARAARKAAEEAELLASNRIKEIIGDADGISGPFGKLTYKRSKDSARVNWEALASSFNPSPQQITDHLYVQPGSRRLLVPTTWTKGES